jgi:signal transduction histidine kinase/DNA-binding NarL/FixJ family response regulator
LPTDEIFFVGTDREGGLWATSSSAAKIFRVATESSVAVISAEDGLHDVPIFALARGRGELLAATANGLFRIRDETGQAEIISTPPGHIWSLLKGPADRWYVGLDRGLAQVGEAGPKLIWETFNDVFALSPPLAGKTPQILAGAGHALTSIDPKSGRAVVLFKNLSATPSSIAQDRAGNYWMGSSNSGIIACSPTAPPARSIGSPVTAGHGLVVGSPTGSVLAFGASSAWLLPAGGLSFVPVRGFPGGNAVAAEGADMDGSAWVILPASGRTPPCVGYVRVHDGAAEWEPRSIPGLWTVGTPSHLAAAKDGPVSRLWISGNAGLLEARVSDSDTPAPPPAPLVSVLDPNGNRLNEADDGGEAVLHYPMRDLALQVAAPSFGRRPAIKIQAWVEGYDRRWTDVHNSGERELARLPDGQYTIRVRSVAETGLIAEARPVLVTVLPPWWRTWTALAGFVIGGSGLVYALFQLRLRGLRRRTVELEAIVRRRTEQADQASAAKTDFVASISHDIRNPLNGIVGLSLALEATGLDAEQQGYISALRGCASYLTTLVDGVLDFAKIEAGKIDLHPEPFSPRQLLVGIAAALQTEAKDSGSIFEVIADSVPEVIVGDCGRLQQILMNYATNALKYASGTIRLRVSVPAGQSEELEFSVEDNGPGFTDDEKRVLFTRFTRFTTGSAKGKEGTGLGLAVCRRIADLMGGSVGVESCLGRGARFFVRLPLVTTVLASESGPQRFSFSRVLLVEDTDYNAWATKAILAKLGIRVDDRATTGAEAASLFKAHHYDLVLLDRNLPDIDGTAVARQLRSLEVGSRRALIVAVTAYSTTDDRALCLQSGMDGFVSKPLTPDKLRRALLEIGLGDLPTAAVSLSPLPAGQAGYSLTVLRYLSDGSAASLRTQMTRYTATLEEYLRQLSQATETQDWSALRTCAHRILSHARVIEAHTLARGASALMEAALGGTKDNVPELAARVAREAATAITFLGAADLGQPTA